MGDSDISTIFGQRLRDLREEYGLVQQDVGSWFNMRKSTVSQWESGRLPHPTIIAELARRFRVSADYLLGLSNLRAPATAQRSNADDLPPEALDRIEEFKELMRLKYTKK